MSTLLAFATRHSVEESEYLTRSVVNKAIGGGHPAVIKALTSVHPKVITFQLGHDALPLYEAVRRGNPDVLAALLELGVNSLRSDKPYSNLSYHTSLMSYAAHYPGPRMIQMLLEHGVLIANTGALYSASSSGRFDTMRLLIEHGANVKEVLYKNWHGRTPMHAAASYGHVDAMKLLKEHGARSDMRDENGKTATQVLEEFSNCKDVDHAHPRH